MHHALQPPPAPAARERVADAFRRLGILARSVRRTMGESWLRRASIKELQRLDARELRDIGIEPYLIEALVDSMLEARRRGE